MATNYRDFSKTEQSKKSPSSRASSARPSASKAHSSTSGKRKSSFEYDIPSVNSSTAHRAGTGSASSRSSSGRSAQGSTRTQNAGRSTASAARQNSVPAESARVTRAGSHSSYAKRYKKRQERTILFGLLLLIALLSVTVTVVVRSISSPEPQVIELDPATDAFKNGVSINGTNVSGMSIDQAREAVKPAIDNVVNSIAVVVKGDGFSATITAGQLNVQTDLESVLSAAFSGNADQSYSTQFSFDREALSLAIRDMNASLSHGATDATFTLDVDSKGKPSINYVEGTPGMGFDIEGTTSLIMNELEAGHFNAEITPALTMVEPSVTVEDLKTQVTKIGSYTTTYCAELPSDQSEEDRMIIENRSFNIGKASDIINGKIIQPGASFSFNKTVGNRTEKNGWKQAKGIYGGETYNMQYGGGVCQVSTTMYVALIRAGIPFSAITRQNHSIPSTYVPKGLDATVDSGHIDFKFKNTTGSPIYIFAYSTVNKKRSRYRDLNVAIYGHALEEGLSYDLRSVSIEELDPGEPIISYNKKQTTDYNVVTVDARPGYVVDVYRDTYMNGKVVSSEMLYEDRYEAVTEKRTVGTIPTPTPEIGIPIENEP